MALPAPDLNIPPSTATVDVSIINTTATLHGVDAGRFIEPKIQGHYELGCPCFSFLIRHPTLNRTLVFDLGIRKDWETSSTPFLVARIEKGGYRINVEKGVREILDDHGVDTAAIEAVVWSHWHFDHVGDPSTFEPSTALIVGPGFKERVAPGYPGNPDATFFEADYQGRELRELSFEGSNIKIGRFQALDYFGDGSFYFLDSPGHAVGHICGFARVTSNPDSYIFMGGDAAHHGGEIRPSPWMPLPDSILPHPFTDSVSVPLCPGEMFDQLLPEGDRTKTFYLPSDSFKIHYDVDATIETIKKVQEADVAENVLVVLAHDQYMLNVVEFFPAPANDFMKKGWSKESRWKFLKDFAQAVEWKGDLVRVEAWNEPKV
ncbi:hypothetical protein GQ53DRAFT_740871 [Thozetella sp. PMI_491]|nr:hypothetical protein GQ53DRAFT_740871 [Thozetella sp. PMI_491]